MDEAECYRRLARALDDTTMWRNLVALLPYTVHVDHERERAQQRAARLLARVPNQRRPLDLQPATRSRR